ncbi:regulator of chromosome condensation RCC1 [Minicystis rosea]|nr:regulator of chromosome condensation RCC1 [Minicystis rosea]
MGDERDLSPQPVAGLIGAAGIVAGGRHACARMRDHTLRCWGSNDRGQLGDGTKTSRFAPASVKSLANVDVVVTAGDTTCAGESAGKVHCWGWLGVSKLGGSAHEASTPTVVPGLAASSVRSLALANRVCARMADASVLCTGDDFSGLGDPSDQWTRTHPAGTTVALAGNGFHVCAVLKVGALDCWGTNAFGELGDGTLKTRHEPVRVVGLADVVEVAPASGNHTCARRKDGSVACWGRNLYGGLGDGTNTDRPVPVPIDPSAR